MRLRAPRDAAAIAYEQAGTPPVQTPWSQAGWCAIDLELTGLHPRKNDIIAIGAIPIEEGRVLLGESLYTLVRTTRRSEHGAVLVHKLRVADLADAPPLPEAIDMLLGVLGGRIPVFHTARVETSFLGPLFSRRRIKLPAAADTEVLGRAWLARRDGQAPPYVTLERLAVELGQPVEPPHHALGDALTTAKVFIALAALLSDGAPRTVGSLVAPERPDGVVGARRFGPA
jgi:DNA polymerase III subunit epsilon